MSRNVSARLAAGVVGALIGVMLLGSGIVTAASTRVVCFDTPDPTDANCSTVNKSTGAIHPGTFIFSQATTGGRSAVTVQVRNDSGSTLNHVKFAGGDVADNLTPNLNPLFPNPYTTPSFDGSTIPSANGVFGLFPAGGCGTLTSTGFLCDIGSLAANAEATFTVVLTPPASGGTPCTNDSTLTCYPVWFTASWNEGWSSTGSNADYTFASGNIEVGDPTCALGQANYFLPSDPVSLSGGSQDCSGRTGFVSSGALGGNGSLGSLGIDPSKPTCPITFSKKSNCLAGTVTVELNGGMPIPGGVQWTITWYGINSLTGVIHYLKGYDPSNPATYETIPLTKAFQCPSPTALKCWLQVIPSKNNANPLTITVIFNTQSNGKGGGWI